MGLGQWRSRRPRPLIFMRDEEVDRLQKNHGSVNANT
jgi:hypothetical protein